MSASKTCISFVSIENESKFVCILSFQSSSTSCIRFWLRVEFSLFSISDNVKGAGSEGFEEDAPGGAEDEVFTTDDAKFGVVCAGLDSICVLVGKTAGTA